MDTEWCSRSNARCSLTVSELKTVCGRDDRLPEGMLKHEWFISSSCKGGPKRFLIHTQQNATSYAYMHQHIPDQTHNMTWVHSDSNTYFSSQFIGAACVASRHSVIVEERSLCLCVVIINSLCLSKWSRRSQCCEESWGDATCMNSAEARGSLA